MERYIEALGDMIDFLNSGWYELDDKIPDMYSELDIEDDWDKMEIEDKSHLKNTEIWAMKKKIKRLERLFNYYFCEKSTKTEIKTWKRWTRITIT